MNEQNTISLEEVNAMVVSAYGSDDTEHRHAYIDGACEMVVRMVAAQHPDALEAGRKVAELLDTEEREDWGRWYA